MGGGGGGGGGRKKRRGSKLFQIGYRMGGRLNFFIKSFRVVWKLIARYILTGVHSPRWVKQLNSGAQTINVKQ